jgi:hypothetical protein
MREESEVFVKSQLGVVLGLDEEFSPHRFSWSHLKASLNVDVKSIY